MGLERLTVVLQGVKSNYETDLLKNIVEFVAKLSGRKCEAETQEGFAMRVIADHARATAFSIADGILPANEGRNYVLRKIMRRAIYHGRHTLGFDKPFFSTICQFVVNHMRDAYPELEVQRDFIDKMVRLEEERFGNTLIVGLNKLEETIQSKAEEVQKWKRNAQPQLTIHDVAYLYDTFGTPIDLMYVRLGERNAILVNPYNPYDSKSVRNLTEDEFRDLAGAGIKDLQKEGGASDQTKKGQRATAIYSQVSEDVPANVFRGYEDTIVENARVVSLIEDGKRVGVLNEGDEGEVILDQTPFYAESGGQVGDVGRIISPVATAPGTDLNATRRGESGTGVPPLNHAQDARATSIATVTDTYSPAQGLIVHKVKVEKGTLKVGDVVTAEVDIEKRDATRRNHTATHLVHAALREVLGSHVKQAGSVVAPNYLRFDFNHYQPMTEDEIKEVEWLVNEQILSNVKVETDIMPVEDAIRAGAMALFGEKYSGMMRVLTVPGFSKELCGGTHVRATGDIGVFKITSDESIASGVRRIRAVTGIDAYQRFREDEEIIGQVTSDLRTSRAELPAMIGKLQDELKKARREADELRLKIATGAAGSSVSNGDDAREVAGVRVLVREASGLDAAGMRQLSDTLLARIKSGVVVLGRSNDGKASLIVRTSDDLTRRVPAGKIIKELAPIIGGKGGGKADMAEGGGNQPEKLAEALQASYDVVERLLS
jgi:alanyl-tRNA synthetase